MEDMKKLSRRDFLKGSAATALGAAFLGLNAFEAKAEGIYTPGTYSATLTAANRMGDTITLPLTIQIIDNSTTRPSITLSKYLIYVARGEEPDWKSYLDQVTDPLSKTEDKTVSNSKVTVNAARVDTSVPGVSEVYYYYTGLSGEIATVILTVIVE